jgi:Leucine-rich repeat (LRR) protein
MRAGVEGELLTFNDEFIRTKARVSDSQNLEAFRFDYSPSIGKIFRIEPLDQFKSLMELSLIGHGIENITGFQSLQRLRRLNLSWNQIATVTPLLKLPHLEDVTLSHNCISTIPAGASVFKSLRVLRIGFNPIRDRKEFLKLQPLLSLANIDIEAVPSHATRSLFFSSFSRCPKLF